MDFCQLKKKRNDQIILIINYLLQHEHETPCAVLGKVVHCKAANSIWW